MRRALVVGINNYPSAPLKGCVNDASELAGILRTNSNGSPNFDVILRTDIASWGELKGMIEELFKGELEAALFYFSGHGYVDATGGKLVTPDFARYDEGVSMDEIMTLANKSKTRNRVVILDCCHSGAFGAPPMGNTQQSSE